MNAIVEKALTFWGLDEARFQLVAARENKVFRVEAPRGPVALRLHRPGYRSGAELRSELQWMSAVAAHGLVVPEPIRSKHGDLIHDVDGVHADVLTWLNGTPIGETGVPLAHPDRTGLFEAIGVALARLHDASDAWILPADFQRPRWDRAGLLGATPLWGRFWENPSLSNDERGLLKVFRQTADAVIAGHERSLDYGLIHADLLRENTLVDQDEIQLIDFDDGGFGFRLFDVATTLNKNRNEPDYEDLRTALIRGYRSVRRLDVALLDLFIAIRAMTYVGWIIQRIAEPGAETRNRRFVKTATELAREFLEQRQTTTTTQTTKTGHNQTALGPSYGSAPR
ncbi:MAG: homoserine kinase [Pseudomonadota bacterium]